MPWWIVVQVPGRVIAFGPLPTHADAEFYRHTDRRIHTRPALVVEADDEAAARTLAWPGVRETSAEAAPAPASAITGEPEDVRAAKAALVRAKAEGDNAAVAAAWSELRAARAHHAETALRGPSDVPVQIHRDEPPRTSSASWSVVASGQALRLYADAGDHRLSRGIYQDKQFVRTHASIRLTSSMDH